MEDRKPNDAVEAYLRKAVAGKKQTPAVASARFRRLTGLWVGALTGIVYGLISQGVNPLAAPGVPLYHPPLGLVGNVGAYTAVGALVGVVTAWKAGALNSVALGAVVGLVLIEAYGWLTNATSAVADLLGTSAAVAVNIVGAISIYGLLLPVLLPLRWAVAVQGEQQTRPFFSWLRCRPLLVILAVTGMVGVMSLYPTPALSAITQMNDLVRAGLTARAPASLPHALQSSGVRRFPELASPDYTLQWNDRLIAAFDDAELRAADLSYPTVVLARFRGSYYLICAFGHDDVEPICKDAWVARPAQRANRSFLVESTYSMTSR
jgi:hypothetical protein